MEIGDMKKIKKRVIVKKPNMKTIGAGLAGLACAALMVGCSASGSICKYQIKDIEQDCMDNNPTYAEIVEYELQKVKNNFENGHINRGEYFSKSDEIVNVFNEEFFEKASDEEQIKEYEKTKNKSIWSEFGFIASACGMGFGFGFATHYALSEGFINGELKEIEVDEDEQVM